MFFTSCSFICFFHADDEIPLVVTDVESCITILENLRFFILHEILIVEHLDAYRLLCVRTCGYINSRESGEKLFCLVINSDNECSTGYFHFAKVVRQLFDCCLEAEYKRSVFILFFRFFRMKLLFFSGIPQSLVDSRSYVRKYVMVWTSPFTESLNRNFSCSSF